MFLQLGLGLLYILYSLGARITTWLGPLTQMYCPRRRGKARILQTPNSFLARPLWDRDTGNVYVARLLMARTPIGPARWDKILWPVKDISFEVRKCPRITPISHSPSPSVSSQGRFPHGTARPLPHQSSLPCPAPSSLSMGRNLTSSVPPPISNQGLQTGTLNIASSIRHLSRKV